MKPKVTKSSGNVYADLGFEAEEAENRRIRGVLMMEIERYIKRSGLKQAQAAAYFGVRQPEISHLLNRNIDRFSIDKLVNMASQIGKQINLKIKPAQALKDRQKATKARPSESSRKVHSARVMAG
jgi:predicted XRE-type DNA-binding protein